ncbi:MAG TPA: fatty acid desaturase [Acidimicrobiales bacterium]|nr:fatty acid desaturase [Acidimicrobiales bacterium]
MPVAVAIGFCSAVLAALVTEIYCHRCLAHRAFVVHPVVASGLDTYFQVVVGTHPQTWAAVHRLHHRYADTPLDPHSPLQRRPVAVLLGNAYLFAMARRRLPPDSPSGRGAVHLFLRVVLVGSFFVVFGLVQVLAMVVVHLVCYLGVMGLVNTAGHLYGRKPHPDVPGYDLAWLAIPLLGHGYHNSHHAHPAAARTGFLDPVWPLLRVLAGLRLLELDGGRHADVTSRSCCRASARPHGSLLQHQLLAGHVDGDGVALPVEP